MIALRDYQQLIFDCVVWHWLNNYQAPVIVVPTGGGKTYIAAHLIYWALQRGMMCQIIAHRKELLSQISLSLAKCGIHHTFIAAAETIKRCSDKHVKELGDTFYTPSANVCVSSIDKLLRADTSKFEAHVGLTLVDEGHHVVENNKWGIISERFPNSIFGFLTASPIRTDRQGLGRGHGGLADSMILGPTGRELIDAGHLCDYEIMWPQVANLDMSKVPVSKLTGEFDKKRTKAALANSKIIGDAVQHYLDMASGLPTIAFTHDVDDSHELARRFRERGVKAIALDGTTSASIRDNALEALAAGEIDVLCNCALFDEGLDVPGVWCVLDCAPTRSFGRFCQRFGRMLRTIAGVNKVAKYIDCVGNVAQFLEMGFGLPDEPQDWTLEAETKRKRRTLSETLLTKTFCKSIKCRKHIPTNLSTCPYCGTAQKVENVSNERLKSTRGKLVPMDLEELRELRKNLSKVDWDVPGFSTWAHGALSPPAAHKAIKAHKARQHAQNILRPLMAQWAERYPGIDDHNIRNHFIRVFGVDSLRAVQFGETKALSLAEKITTQLQRSA